MNGCNTHVAAPRTNRPVRSMMDELFEGVFPAGQAGAYTPSIDLTETPEAYAVRMDVPGMTLEQIHVQFAENVLTLNGERTVEAQNDNQRWHVVERGRGAFARSIRFPGTVDAANVTATMKNGVLTVTVPKAAAARTQKIKVVEA